MNIFVRFGQWLESRRVIRYPELKIFIEALEFERKETDRKFNAFKIQFIDEMKIPQTIAKELALIKARLDRLELLTGLKREPEATHVKDAPRIQ